MTEGIKEEIMNRDVEKTMLGNKKDLVKSKKGEWFFTDILEPYSDYTIRCKVDSESDEEFKIFMIGDPVRFILKVCKVKLLEANVLSEDNINHIKELTNKVPCFVKLKDYMTAKINEDFMSIEVLAESDGTTLEEIIKNIDTKLIASVCIQCVHCLKFTYAIKIAPHRISPSTIYICKDRVKIELVPQYRKFENALELKSKQKRVFFAPPEFSNEELSDISYKEKVDIYSLGMTLLCLITKRMPSELSGKFSFANKEEYENNFLKVAGEEVKKIADKTEEEKGSYANKSKVTTIFSDIMLRCLRFNPNERPSFSNLCEFFKQIESETYRNNIEEINENLMLGNAYLSYLGRNSDVSYYFGKVLELVGKLTEKEKEFYEGKERAKFFNAIGKAYYIEDNNKQAIMWYIMAMKIIEASEKDEDLAEILVNLGDVYYDDEEYNTAFHYYERMEKCATKESIEIASAFFNMGMIYKREKSNYLALFYHKKALEMKERILGKYNFDIGRSYLAIGQLLRLQGEKTEELAFYKKANEILEKATRIHYIKTSQLIRDAYGICMDFKEKKSSLNDNEKEWRKQIEALGKDHADVIQISVKVENLKQELRDSKKEIEFYRKLFDKVQLEKQGKEKAEKLLQNAEFYTMVSEEEIKSYYTTHEKEIEEVERWLSLDEDQEAETLSPAKLRKNNVDLTSERSGLDPATKYFPPSTYKSYEPRLYHEKYKQMSEDIDCPTKKVERALEETRTARDKVPSDTGDGQSKPDEPMRNFKALADWNFDLKYDSSAEKDSPFVTMPMKDLNTKEIGTYKAYTKNNSNQTLPIKTKDDFTIRDKVPSDTGGQPEPKPMRYFKAHAGWNFDLKYNSSAEKDFPAMQQMIGEIPFATMYTKDLNMKDLESYKDYIKKISDKTLPIKTKDDFTFSLSNYNTANELLKGGNKEGALNCYLEFIKNQSLQKALPESNKVILADSYLQAALIKMDLGKSELEKKKESTIRKESTTKKEVIIKKEVKELDEALEYCTKALEIREKLSYENNRNFIELYHNMAQIMLMKGSKKEDNEYLKQSLIKCEELDKKSDEQLFEIYVNLGHLSKTNDRKVDNEHTIGFYRKALQFSDRITEKNPALEAMLYNSMGILYGLLNNKIKAKENIQQALDIKKNTLRQEDLVLAGYYTNLANVEEDLDKTDIALENLFDALKIRRKLFITKDADKERIKTEIALAYNSIGVIYARRKDHKSALFYFNSSLKQMNRISQQANMAIIYNNRGNLYDEMGEIELGFEDMKIAKEIVQREKGVAKIDMARIYYNYASSLLGMKYKSEALTYYTKAYELLVEFLGKDQTETSQTYKNIRAIKDSENKEDRLDGRQNSSKTTVSLPKKMPLDMPTPQSIGKLKREYAAFN